MPTIEKERITVANPINETMRLPSPAAAFGVQDFSAVAEPPPSQFPYARQPVPRAYDDEEIPF
jgi:hypothetical protein